MSTKTFESFVHVLIAHGVFLCTKLRIIAAKPIKSPLPSALLLTLLHYISTNLLVEKCVATSSFRSMPKRFSMIAKLNCGGDRLHSHLTRSHSIKWFTNYILTQEMMEEDLSLWYCSGFGLSCQWPNQPNTDTRSTWTIVDPLKQQPNHVPTLVPFSHWRSLQTS